MSNSGLFHAVRFGNDIRPRVVRVEFGAVMRGVDRSRRMQVSLACYAGVCSCWTEYLDVPHGQIIQPVLMVRAV